MDDTRETPPHTGPPPGGPGPRRGLSAFLDVRRTRDDRLLAGVCTGVARRLDVDPVIVRVLVVVLCFVGLAGFILYAAGWLLLPAEDEEHSHVGTWFGLDEREEQVRSAGLLVAGVLAGLAVVGDGGWGGGDLWAFWVTVWVVGPVALVAWLVSRSRRRPDQPTSTPPTAGVGTAWPAPTTTPSAASVPSSAAGPGSDAGATTSTAVLGLDPSSTRPSSTTASTSAPGAGSPPGRGPLAGPPPAPPSPPRPREPFTWTPTLLTLSVVAIATAVTQLVWAPEWVVHVAVALAVVGLGLVLSTFSRGGSPLFVVGVVLSLLLAVGWALPSLRAGQQVVDPPTASEVAPEYRHGLGELVLDLTDVDDPDALVGRIVRLEVGLGQTRVLLPDDLEVEVDARVRAGDLVVLDERRSGTGQRLVERADGPALTLEIDQTAGQVEVSRR